MPHYRISFVILTISTVLVNAVGSTAAQHKVGPEVTVIKCWEFASEDLVGLATNGKDVFAASEDGRVIGLSAAGEKLWQTDLGGQIESDIEAADGYVVVTTLAASKSTLRRLSQQTGVPAEGASDPGVERPSGTSEFPQNATASASSGSTLVYGDDRGMVVSLVKGETAWKFKTGGSISAVVTLGDDFIVMSRDNFVYSLNARNGGLNWKKRLQGRVAHYAFVDGILLVEALDQHGASAIDLASGRIVGQIALAAEDAFVTDPVVIDGRFVVATSSGVGSYSLAGCDKK